MRVPAQPPKIIENIMMSMVFWEVGGDGGPRPTFRIIENIVISIVFWGGGRSPLSNLINN